MPVTLPNIVRKIKEVPNPVNVSIIEEFHNYMIERNSSENHQINNLKMIVAFANHLGKDTSFYDVKNKDQILEFVNTKIKNNDPQKKWITTWNNYLNRIKIFLRTILMGY